MHKNIENLLSSCEEVIIYSRKMNKNSFSLQPKRFSCILPKSTLFKVTYFTPVDHSNVN